MPFCEKCGKKSIGQFCFQHKPRKPLSTATPMKRGTTRLKPESEKHREKREATTAEFWRLNPPDANGMWTCYLQISPFCLRQMTREQVNPEHTLSKIRHPGLRWEATKLRPACAFCNELKGSRDYINGEIV